MSCQRNSGRFNSKKRKQPDDDEEQLERGLTFTEPIDNEYEDLDDGDDTVVGGDELEKEPTCSREERLFRQTLSVQEESEIDRYDNIEITPFNMKEELEEGEIDEDGNFIRQKEKLNEDNNDTWADSIDWAAVEKKEKERRDEELKKGTTSEQKMNMDDSSPEPIPDKLSCYRKMLRIIRPEETVQKAIRRLGNSVPKRQTKGARSKNPVSAGDTKEIAEAREKLNCLIELAHEVLEEGDIDIYQKSYDQLEELSNKGVS